MGKAPFETFLHEIAPTLGRTSTVPENSGIYIFLMRLRGIEDDALLPHAWLLGFRLAEMCSLLLILALILLRPRRFWELPHRVFAAAAALVAWLLLFSPIFWEHYHAYLAPFWGWLGYEATRSRPRAIAAGAVIILGLFPRAGAVAQPPDVVNGVDAWDRDRTARPGTNGGDCPMTIKEFILAAGALLALILIQMGATHGGALFHQAPWLDEVHTAILVNEPDPDKFHSAISDQCVDANFPVYYEALRTLKIHSLPAIREISMAGTIAALLGIYVLLRGAFKPLESAVGVLAVWSTPEVVYHTFQARFYAPWFAAVIWFAVAMRWTKTAKIPWVAGVALATTSLLACTLHVLGLPAIALVALAEFLADRGPLRSRIVRALPALAGAIAVMLFIPLMVQQKHSFQIKTWLAGNPLRLFYSTIGNLLPGVAASAIVLALFASAWCRKRDDTRPREIALRPLAGMSSLIFFPIVLLALTIVSRGRYFYPVTRCA